MTKEPKQQRQKSSSKTVRLDRMDQVAVRAWLKSVGADHACFPEERRRAWPKTYRYALGVQVVMSGRVRAGVKEVERQVCPVVADRIYQVLKCRSDEYSIHLFESTGALESEQGHAMALTGLTRLSWFYSCLAALCESWAMAVRAPKTPFELAYAQLAATIQRQVRLFENEFLLGGAKQDGDGHSSDR